MFVLHFFRYLPETVCTYVAGSLTIPAGWYNLPKLLEIIDTDGVVDMTWTATTNEVASTANIALDTTQARDLLGWPSGAASASTTYPQSTWVITQGDMGKKLAPVGVNGRKTYDTEFYNAQDGTSFAMGSISQNIEDYEIQLVNKGDIFTITGSTSTTAPLIDSVYVPHLGLEFELVTANFDWATGYSDKPYWCLMTDIKCDMALYPWDNFFNISFSAYLVDDNEI